MPETPPRDWDKLIDRIMLYLSPQDPVRLVDFFTGILCLGSTGTGKTAFVLPNLITPLAQAGCAFALGTVKVGDAAKYARIFEAAGRGGDVIRLSLGDDSGWRYPFLEHEFAAGKSSSSVVGMLMALGEGQERQQGGGNGSQDTFFVSNQKVLLCKVIDMLALAGERICLPNIYEVISTAGQSREEVVSAAWQKNSYLNACIGKALARRDLSPAEGQTLGTTIQYWLSEYVCLGDRTRSSIVSGVTAWLHPLLRGALRQAFSGDQGTIVTPEMLFAGKILILDFPLLQSAENVLPMLIWKESIQRALVRRAVGKHSCGVVLVFDEAQLSASRADSSFVSVCREYRCCNIYLSQSRSAFLRQFNGEQGKSYVDELFSNLRSKIALNQEDPDTCEYFSRLVGESWELKAGVSGNLRGGGRMGFSAQEQKDWVLPPTAFRALGKAKDGKTNAIVIRVAEPFAATGQPFLRTTFSLTPRTVPGAAQ